MPARPRGADTGPRPRARWGGGRAPVAGAAGRANQLRSSLREFYPAALAAFGTDLASPQALAVLAAVPTPAQGRMLSVADLAELLGAAGRQRGTHTRAVGLHQQLASPQLAAPAPVTAAYGQVVTATVGILTEFNQQISALEEDLAKTFETHPDAAHQQTLIDAAAATLQAG